MSDQRIAALQCAVQIVSIGSWKDANHRATTAVQLAEYFLAFLEPSLEPDPDTPEAPAQAMVA